MLKVRKSQRKMNHHLMSRMKVMKPASFAKDYIHILSLRWVGYSALTAKTGHMKRAVMQKNKTNLLFVIFVPKMFNFSIRSFIF